MRNGYLTRNFLEPIPDFLKIHVQNQRSIVCKTNSVHHVILQSIEIIHTNKVAYNWYYLRFLLLRNTAESENADFRSALRSNCLKFWEVNVRSLETAHMYNIYFQRWWLTSREWSTALMKLSGVLHSVKLSICGKWWYENQHQVCNRSPK